MNARVLLSRWLAVSSFALSGALGAQPSAQEVQAALLIDACAGGVPVGDLRAAIELELGSQQLKLVELGAAFARGQLLIEVQEDCQAQSPTALLRLSRAGRQDLRHVDLSELPEAAWARTIALAVAEFAAFVVAERQREMAASELATPSAHPTAAAAPSPTVKTPQPPATAQTPAKLRAAAPAAAKVSDRGASLAPEARFFFDGDALWGGQVRGNVGRFSGGFDVLVGRKRAPGGSISAELAQATLALDLTRWRLPSGFGVAIGPRVGVGLLNVRGSATQASATGGRVLETYVDAALFADAQFHFARAAVGARTELGYAHGVIALADGAPSAVWGGPLTSLSLYFSVDL